MNASSDSITIAAECSNSQSKTSLSDPSSANDSTLHPTQSSKPSFSALNLNSAIWPLDSSFTNNIFSATPPSSPGLSPRRDCKKTLTPKSSTLLKNQLKKSTEGETFPNSAPLNSDSNCARSLNDLQTNNMIENEFMEVESEKGYQTRANIQDGSLQEDSNSNAQELPLFSPSHLSSTETPSPKSKRSRNLSDEVYSSPTRKNLDYQVAEALYLSAPPRTPSKALINSPSRSIKTSFRSPFKQSKLIPSSPSRQIPTSTLLFPAINDSRYNSTTKSSEGKKNRQEVESISSSDTITRVQTNSATPTIQPEDDVFYTFKPKASPSNTVSQSLNTNQKSFSPHQVSAMPTTSKPSTSSKFEFSRQLSPRLLFLLGFVLPPFWIMMIFIPKYMYKDSQVDGLNRVNEKRLELGEGERERERERLRVNNSSSIRYWKRASVIMILVYLVVGTIVGILVGREH